MPLELDELPDFRFRPESPAGIRADERFLWHRAPSPPAARPPERPAGAGTAGSAPPAHWRAVPTRIEGRELLAVMALGLSLSLVSRATVCSMIPGFKSIVRPSTASPNEALSPRSHESAFGSDPAAR